MRALAILSAVLLLGCSGAEKSIPEERMAHIMKDILLAHNGSFLYSSGSREVINRNRIYLMKEVLEHHNLTVEEMQTALDEYATDPKEMNKVMNRALTLLSTEQAKLKGTFKAYPKQ